MVKNKYSHFVSQLIKIHKIIKSIKFWFKIEKSRRIK